MNTGVNLSAFRQVPWFILHEDMDMEMDMDMGPAAESVYMQNKILAAILLTRHLTIGSAAQGKPFLSNGTFQSVKGDHEYRGQSLSFFDKFHGLLYGKTSIRNRRLKVYIYQIEVWLQFCSPRRKCIKGQEDHCLLFLDILSCSKIRGV